MPLVHFHCGSLEWMENIPGTAPPLPHPTPPLPHLSPPPLPCRIQSIACSPSTSLFAISAVGVLSQPVMPHGTSKTTVGLTSPHLPSQMAKPNEMLTMTKRVLSSHTTGRFQPTPGELTVWDITEQKIRVYWHVCMCVCSD